MLSPPQHPSSVVSIHGHNEPVNVRAPQPASRARHDNGVVGTGTQLHVEGAVGHATPRRLKGQPGGRPAVDRHVGVARVAVAIGEADAHGGEGAVGRGAAHARDGDDAVDVAANVAGGASGRAAAARDDAGAAAQLRDLALVGVDVAGGLPGGAGRGGVGDPGVPVLERDGGARDVERQPDVGAGLQVGRHPAVAQVHDVAAVAVGEDVGGLRRVRVAALVGKGLPAAPGARDGRRRAVDVVVGVPAGELGPKHVVGAVALEHGGRLDAFAPQVRRRVVGKAEVVVCQTVDAQAVFALGGGGRFFSMGQLSVFAKDILGYVF